MDDILNIVSEAERNAEQNNRKAVIIQPGAIGDCVLTLPLAESLKTHFGIGTILMLGRSQYIEYFPGRTCIDGIRDLDSVDLHRLFVNHKEFELADGDSLIGVFSGFEQIITFLGQAGSDFENNLIFTANCSNPVEVTTLQLKPGNNYAGHITKFHLDMFLSSQASETKAGEIDLKKTYIIPCKTDLANGQKILSSAGVDTKQKVAIIHPGSGSTAKNWHIDNFYMVAETLREKKNSVAFLLGPAEMETFKPEIIDALGAIAPLLVDISLTEALGAISCASCFIGNDSGLTHIAAAAGIPVIACWAATNPVHYHPVGPNVTVFQLDSSDFASPCPQKADEVSKTAIKLLTS
ncbi:MAG: glycosyltransferase family 9 protein [Phycisphaerae bacterium]|jgi:ADP-heptose:LPS heptosyltransferase